MHGRHLTIHIPVWCHHVDFDSIDPDRSEVAQRSSCVQALDHCGFDAKLSVVGIVLVARDTHAAYVGRVAIGNWLFRA
jgi:hypothetical protein